MNTARLSHLNRSFGRCSQSLFRHSSVSYYLFPSLYSNLIASAAYLDLRTVNPSRIIEMADVEGSAQVPESADDVEMVGGEEAGEGVEDAGGAAEPEETTVAAAVNPQTIFLEYLKSPIVKLVIGSGDDETSISAHSAILERSPSSPTRSQPSHRKTFRLSFLMRLSMHLAASCSTNTLASTSHDAFPTSRMASSLIQACLLLTTPAHSFSSTLASTPWQRSLVYPS